VTRHKARTATLWDFERKRAGTANYVKMFGLCLVRKADEQAKSDEGVGQQNVDKATL
jgi:hypothetical protein